MKESYIHNDLKKAKTIYSLLLVALVLLAHLNFSFSDYISFFANETIEFSGLDENGEEEENAKEKEKYVFVFQKINLSSQLIKQPISYSSSNLYNQYIEIFTPPPESI